MFDCDSMLDALEKELRAALNTTITGFVAMARSQLEDAVAEVTKERTQGLAEVAEERAKGLADVAKERAAALAMADVRRRELSREVEAMHKHKEAQEGRVDLNIGGHQFQTSVQTLHRVPHTFFDAYFSGRYAQDVCDDGSIFVDRDGEHFGHVLQYMRDGVVSVAQPGACPSVSLLRALKREFGFYCIELVAEQVEEPEQSEVAYVMGGQGTGSVILSSMERYDATSGQWSAVAAMGTARVRFGYCVMAGEIYVTGGHDTGGNCLSSVERYSPSSDSWSAVAPLPAGRSRHATVEVGSVMYVLGGAPMASVLKFDSKQGTWSRAAPMPVAKNSFAACAIGNDIYVFGGSLNHLPQTSVFMFDTEANTWSTLAPMPHDCVSQNASLLGGLVYIVGAGQGGREVLRFDPASGAWSTLAPTLSRRRREAPFVLSG
jgi:hypothetical protein